MTALGAKVNQLEQELERVQQEALHWFYKWKDLQEKYEPTNPPQGATYVGHTRVQ